MTGDRFMLTPRKRVELALRKEYADKVPLTIYESLMPRCTCERKLRDDGLCLISGNHVYSTTTPNVKQYNEGYFENGIYKQRCFFETPYGALTKVLVPKPGTTWTEKELFSSPDDYRAILFMIQDEVYTEAYAEFARWQDEKGPDFFCRAGLGYEPLQHIMTKIMGVEAFCLEWMDNRDEILKLYDAMTAQRRKQYKLAAASPALCVQYGGNISPEITGLERFKEYYLPHYQEALEELHKHGKIVGVHLDANNKLLAPEIAKTGLDYVEAFTPPPDCDMGVKEALDMWENKTLWINFPSSVHLAETEVIKAATRQILKEGIPGNRLMIGVTEDIPQNDCQRSMTAISEVINSEGILPLK